MTVWRGIAGAEAREKTRWEELTRERIRGTIELIVEEELDEALGAGSSERVWAKNGLGIGTAVARTP